MPRPARIALVGFGLVGRRHARAIRQAAGVQLAAVVEPDPAARADARQTGVAVFAALEEMFAGIAVDGAVLATPTPLHVAQGLACVEQGCPVLIEKPVGVTAQEATALLRAADARQVPLLVGHHRRHSGVAQAARAAIAGGMIGQVRAVQATCWFYKPDGYFDAAPWRRRKGAGPISVNLVHDVDLLRYFCGEVVQVQAQAVPSRRGYENEDLAAAILTFASGAVATVSVADAVVSPWSWELTARENPVYPAMDASCYLIGGTVGALSVPDMRIWQHQGRPDWWAPMGTTILPVFTDDPLVMQARHFGRVIRGEETPLVSGREGVMSLQVVEAVQLSADRGCSVTLPDKDKQDRG